MSDLQQVVDEIRFRLERESAELARGEDPSDELQRAIEAYRGYCRQCNQRLRQCEDALRKGLRAEALHLAEAPPNLLDMVAILDFPELEELIEVLAGGTVDVPERLLIDVASDLNEAYTLQQPMEALLNRHRLLAVARSPLPARLEVLRKLAELDSDSPHWKKDVRDMEVERISEIEAESRTAARNLDLPTLKALYAELTATTWENPPPSHLVQSVKQLGTQAVKRGAQARLEELVPQLHAAFSELDLLTAGDLRDEWQKHAATAGISDHDPLAEQVAPVLAWIADEERKASRIREFQQAVAALERGLDDESLSSSELAQLGLDVEKYDQGIPETLVRRFRNRLAGAQLHESRRYVLFFAGIVSAVVLVGAGIGYAIYSMQQARATREILAAVDNYIATGELEEARQLMNEHAARATSEVWLSRQQQIVAAEKKETERQAQFADAVSAVKKEKNTEAALKAVETARPLAKTADEKLSLGTLEQKLIDQQTREIADRERSFRETLASAGDRVKQLESLESKPDTDAEIRPILEALTDELKTLARNQGSVASELAVQYKVLETRLEAFNLLRNRRHEQERIYAELSAATLIDPAEADLESKIALYLGALQEFQKKFPKDPRCAGFQQAGTSKAIELWSARLNLVRGWPHQLLPQNSEDLARREQDCQSFLAEFSTSPDRPLIEMYQTLLKSIRRRETGDEGSQSVKDQINKLFGSPLIGEGNILRMRDGRTYYLPEPVDFSKKVLVNFDYLIGYDGETKHAKSIKVEDVETLQSVKPPQLQLAERVGKEIYKLDIAGWDAFHEDLALQIVEAKGEDPFLRYLLLLRVLKLAGAGNTLLDAKLVPLQNMMREKQVDLSVSWMDPDDKNAGKVRAMTEVLLAEMKPDVLRAAWESYRKQQQLLAQVLLSPPRGVGWLNRDGASGWKLQTDWKPAEDHLLYVAVPRSPQEKTPQEKAPQLEWRQIGRINSNGASLSFYQNREGITEGLVVFASPTPVTPPK